MSQVLILLINLINILDINIADPAFDHFDHTDSSSIQLPLQADVTDDTLNSFVDEQDADIDTFGWHNFNINSGRIDCSMLFDTVKIPLVDYNRERYYVHPSPGYITSNFGDRDGSLWHYGVDIKLLKGDTVNAAFDGIVRVEKYDRHGYGNVVVIRHHDGLESIYGHLSKALVKPNQKVKAGDVVGLGGNTGRSTGSHLHFELRYYGEPFDPNLIVDFTDYRLKSDTLCLYKDNFAYLQELRKAVCYRIRNGDNLGKIAKRYHTSIASICRLNHITPRTTLSIGRKLIVRGAKS